MKSRYRPIALAASGILAVWLLAWGGFTLARNSKMTAEKVRVYLEETDLGKLSGEARARALRKLTDMLNRLSPEERRRARTDGLARRWFDQMTEEEKSAFIEATLPTGFKQMINAFEKLPEERRKKVIDDSVRRMREARERGESSDPFQRTRGTNQPPVLSKELQEKVTAIGLKSFYSQSTAQSKAEIAPLLEEIQRSMESGRMFRRGQ